MKSKAGLIEQIEQMLKDAEEARDNTTDDLQDYYCTGYMDARYTKTHQRNRSLKIY